MLDQPQRQSSDDGAVGMNRQVQIDLVKCAVALQLRRRYPSRGSISCKCQRSREMMRVRSATRSSR